MRSARQTFSVLAAAAVISLSSGCSIFDGDSSSDRDRPTLESRIPSRATVVKEGRGELEYTASADGTIYVQDDKTDAVVVSRKVKRGDRVRVQFDDDRVRVGDDTVYDGNLERDNAHKIYLLRDGADRDRGDRNANPDRVPTSATLVGEGSNKEINYRANRDGTIYVYDAGEKKVIGSAGIRDGQRFQLSPGIDRATIDANAIDVGGLDTRSFYRVYFDRD